MPFNRVLIITLVCLAEPLRGHDLGAWMVAEVISRMSGACDTLVLLYPFPAGDQLSEPAEFAAVNALTAHWMKVGLERIEIEQEFLGQSTAYATLSKARRALSHVESVKISVPASGIRPDVAPFDHDCRDVFDDLTPRDAE